MTTATWSKMDLNFTFEFISRNRRLRLITLTETSIILDITKTESYLVIALLYIERKNN